MSPALQHTVLGRKKILAIGEDFALLATRAAVLARTDASVTCCNSAEFATQLDRERFDLVILCYSLADSVRQAISADVHHRWPQARLLLVTAEPFPVSFSTSDVDAVTASMQPAQLIRAATSLLETPPL
jgi:DNA-binding NtrC family response regulator